MMDWDIGMVLDLARKHVCTGYSERGLFLREDELLQFASRIFAKGQIFERENHDWPIQGVRVDGDKVVISVGDNGAARWLCGEILATRKKENSK